MVSDALFVGDSVKAFKWSGFDAYLKDKQYQNSEGNLAGAAISMADALQNSVKHIHISLEEAVQMATIRPAIAINSDNDIGKIAVGYPARFTVFNEQMNNFQTLAF